MVEGYLRRHRRYALVTTPWLEVYSSCTLVRKKVVEMIAEVQREVRVEVRKMKEDRRRSKGYLFNTKA
jgi:hypothetical protein